MSESENTKNELDPRLEQMLKTYAITPERDPESARHNQERFVAILNMIFDEQITPKPAPRWFDFSTWPARFNQLLPNPIRRRAILLAFAVLIVFALFLFGGVGITAYAASSSLPGDTLYPLKTTMENVRVALTTDPAAQARLSMVFAGRRLSEIQSLIGEGRFDDIPQATSEFERDIQQAVIAIESLSKTDRAESIGLSAELTAILRGFDDILIQMLAVIPDDAQPAIQSAINVSRAASNSLDASYDDFNYDDDSNEDDNGSTPSPQASNTPQLTDTPQPLSNAIVASPIAETPIPSSATSEPTEAPAIADPSADTVGGEVPVIEGEDGTCQGLLGAVTVDNLYVPQGASCTLNGTRVQGTIQVDTGASLTAEGVTVIGNIQAEGASFVGVWAGSTVGGNVQIKQGGGAQIANVIVNGDIQFESNQGGLSATGNQVGGNVQIFQNVGGITVADNSINGNLQCKENNPAPSGGNNTVQGNKEDQCDGL